jgi:hypothetical protein
MQIRLPVEILNAKEIFLTNRGIVRLSKMSGPGRYYWYSDAYIAEWSYRGVGYRDSEDNYVFDVAYRRL